MLGWQYADGVASVHSFKSEQTSYQASRSEAAPERCVHHMPEDLKDPFCSFFPAHTLFTAP